MLQGNHPPRVCHVLRKFIPTEWGGAETHVAAIAHEQAKLGWSTRLMAPASPASHRGPLSRDVELEHYSSFLPFLGPGERRSQAIQHAGNIASLDLPLRVAAHNPAVVHLHTGRRIGGAAALGARLRGRPYVVSLHGPVASDKDWLRDETEKRYRGLIDLGKPIGLFLGARSVLQRADRVICFNEREEEALHELLPAHRVVRMSQGVDVQRLGSGDANLFRAAHPAIDARTLIACVGRLSRQKNQRLAVEAFAYASPEDTALIFAGGETDKGYEEALRKRATELGCHDRVHFLGNVSQQEVANLLAASRLALVPSSQEAFGLTAVEAWAANRPALCALTAGIAPMASTLSHQEFFMRTDDSAQWGRRLSQVLEDQAARCSMAEEGRALVRRELSWTSRAQELTTLYARVIAENRT